MSQHPQLQNDLSSLKIFTGSVIDVTLQSRIPFVDPVYSTCSEIFNGITYNKWKIRSDIGMYLGISPLHLTRVTLVINPWIILVSQ